MGEGVIAADVDGKIMGLNPVAEKLTGWKEAAARGKKLETIFEIKNSTTGAVLANPVLQVLETGQIGRAHV